MLQQSVQVESLVDLFQQSLDSGVIGVNSDNSIFVCSPKAAEILEIPAEKLFSRHMQDVLSCFPLAESLENRKAIHNREVEYQGTRINVSIQPFYQNSMPIGAFCIFHRICEKDKHRSRIRRQIANTSYVTKYTFDSIIGECPAMQNAKALAKKMAASNAAILISGESGTGKELFAHAIHAASSRANHPFVSVNCAAIPDSLLESQFFGYEDGAFTGAKEEGILAFSKRPETVLYFWTRLKL